MRMFQYISLSAVLLLTLSNFGISQASVPDTKLMWLKGHVRSLVSTSKSISGYAEWVLKDKTKYQTTYLFNREGYLTEMIYEGGSNERYLYSKIDGYKTFKTIELKTPDNNGRRLTVVDADEEKPIEPNERLTEPDKRFDFKYVYETDNRGRIVSERQYQNNGKLFRKCTYQYTEAGVLMKETEEDTIAIMTYSFTYDEKGKVVEVNKTRDIRGPGSDSRERIIYTELKFDSAGNWTERKTTSNVETDPMPQSEIPAQKYTFVDMETRALTYY
jgi:hypothetical protein